MTAVEKLLYFASLITSGNQGMRYANEEREKMRDYSFLVFVVASLALTLTIFGCSEGNISEKQVFYDVAAAEDRADLEASKQANGCVRGGLDLDVEKWASLLRPLMERYRNEVLAEYGVSEERWTEILVKGVKEGWDLPEPLTC